VTLRGKPPGRSRRPRKSGRGFWNRRALLVLTLVSASLAVAVVVVGFVVREHRFVASARRISAVAFPGGTVAVEVAVTPCERRQGLAGREALPTGRGMLFVYPDTRPRTFTMEGMRFGLDIITLSAEGVVTGVVTKAPGGAAFETAPARYVLEVPAGWAAAHGVEAGTRATLVGP